MADPGHPFEVPEKPGAGGFARGSAASSKGSGSGPNSNGMLHAGRGPAAEGQLVVQAAVRQSGERERDRSMMAPSPVDGMSPGKGQGVKFAEKLDMQVGSVCLLWH